MSRLLAPLHPGFAFTLIELLVRIAIVAILPGPSTCAGGLRGSHGELRVQQKAQAGRKIIPLQSTTPTSAFAETALLSCSADCVA